MKLPPTGTIVPIKLLVQALLGVWLGSLLDEELLCRKGSAQKLLCKQTWQELRIYGRAGGDPPTADVCPASGFCIDQRDVFVSMNSRFAGG